MDAFALDILQVVSILFIVPLLFLFYMNYMRISRESIKRKTRKDTIDFCFQDDTNYEELVHFTATEQYQKTVESSFNPFDEKLKELVMSSN